MRNEEFRDFLSENKQEHMPVVLTPAEAMDILGVGKNTMYRLLSSGELCGIRVGRNWRISGDVLNQFISHPNSRKNS